MSDVAHEIKRAFAKEALEAKLTATHRARHQQEDGQHAAKAHHAVVFSASVGKVNATTKMLESKDIPRLVWTGETAARNESPGHNGRHVQYSTSSPLWTSPVNNTCQPNSLSLLARMQ